MRGSRSETDAVARGAAVAEQAAAAGLLRSHEQVAEPAAAARLLRTFVVRGWAIRHAGGFLLGTQNHRVAAEDHDEMSVMLISATVCGYAARMLDGFLGGVHLAISSPSKRQPLELGLG